MQAKQTRRSKPEDSIPPCPLSQFLIPGSQVPSVTDSYLEDENQRQLEKEFIWDHGFRGQESQVVAEPSGSRWQEMWRACISKAKQEAKRENWE